MAIFGQYSHYRKPDARRAGSPIQNQNTRRPPATPRMKTDACRTSPAFGQRLHRLPGMVGFQRFSRIQPTKNF